MADKSGSTGQSCKKPVSPAKQKCIHDFLQNNYGSFMANTGVPSFSAISLFTNTLSWLEGEGATLLAKGALSAGPMAYGKLMTTTGTNLLQYPGQAAARPITFLYSVRAF